METRIRLILHIGSTKTGSSALQAFLAGAREDLRARGVLYPQTGTASHAHHVLFGTVHQSAHRLHADAIGADRHACLDKLVADLRAEIEGFDGHTVLLSSEYLWTIDDPSRVASLCARLGFPEFTVVAYLRELTAWLQSQYGQAVKSREGRKFRQWLRPTLRNPNGGAQYGAILQRWADLPGTRELVARGYGRDTLPDGVIADFLGWLSPDLAAFAPEHSPRANPSLTPGDVELLALVNGMELGDDMRAEMRNLFLARAPKRQQFSPYPHLQKPEMTVVENHVGDSLDEVRAYLVPEHRDMVLLDRRMSGDRMRIDNLTESVMRLFVEVMRMQRAGR